VNGLDGSESQDGATDATLVERVARELRAEIIAGQLKPGQRIPQVTVAGRYGTSRLPVREALRQLQSEGLVKLVPNGSARVVRFEAAELDEVYWLRERLEPPALAESVPQLSDAQLEAARRCVDEMNGLEDDPAGWLAADGRFHATALAACPLPRVLQTIESLWNLALPYRRIFMNVAWGPRLATIQRHEHGLLADALERRDGNDARRLLQMHIRRTRLSLERYPELFEH
jgi:DNA-binding GntR family transcriptional regulator